MSENIETKLFELREFEIKFNGGWCYVMADKIVINKTTGQRIFYAGEKIVGIIRLNAYGMLIEGYDISEAERSRFEGTDFYPSRAKKKRRWF